MITFLVYAGVIVGYFTIGVILACTYLIIRQKIDKPWFVIDDIVQDEDIRDPDTRKMAIAMFCMFWPLVVPGIVLMVSVHVVDWLANVLVYVVETRPIVRNSFPKEKKDEK